LQDRREQKHLLIIQKTPPISFAVINFLIRLLMNTKKLCLIKMLQSLFHFDELTESIHKKVITIKSILNHSESIGKQMKISICTQNRFPSRSFAFVIIFITFIGFCFLPIISKYLCTHIEATVVCVR
jgi:hypothetical protein